MKMPRWQTLVSLGLIGCMTLSLMPLGCYPVKLNHSAAPMGSPHIPEATAARLRECVEELEGEINHGYYSVDAKVKVDEDGEIVGVEMEGTPNPSVGGCMRIALRSMRLPKDVLETSMLRMSASANGQAMPDRGQIGEVVIITVVTIVFTEVIIEAFALAIGVTVTATLATGVTEAMAKRKEKGRSCSDHLGICLEKHPKNGPGEHHGASLCHACWKKCSNGDWPAKVRLDERWESCVYE